MKSVRFPAGIVLTLLLSCCDGGLTAEEGPAPKGLRSVPADGLEKVSNERLFFGHQSVGFNIIEGLDEILRDNGRRKLVSVETRDPGAAAGPCLLHSTIGSNGDPLGKIRDFDAIMRGGMAERVDVAFMKLCYVDIQAGTDVEEVFRAYRDTMAALRASFPRTTFVNLTVPLETREKGPKSLVKRLIGRTLRGSVDNLAREELNVLLRNEYAGRAPLFDLSRFESTRADGSRTAFGSGDGRYHALVETYSDDGGHLNKTGRRFIAEQLLVFLAGLDR